MNDITPAKAWSKCPCPDVCRATSDDPCLCCWEDAGDILAGTEAVERKD